MQSRKGAKMKGLFRVLWMLIVTVLIVAVFAGLGALLFSAFTSYGPLIVLGAVIGAGVGGFVALNVEYKK